MCRQIQNTDYNGLQVADRQVSIPLFEITDGKIIDSN